MNVISKSNLLAAKGSSIIGEGGKELQRRLTLYHVFLKLYEQRRDFLNEILQLENPHTSVKQLYIQGIANGCAVYVITNLCDGETLSLQQPQQIWTMGRDRSNGIRLCEQYVSRHHAAIRYIDHQGFYLIDFNSTNGSYINEERVYQPTKLKDGDRLRLGSMTFSFFVNITTRILPTLGMESLTQLVTQTGEKAKISPDKLAKKHSFSEDLHRNGQFISEQSLIIQQPSAITADRHQIIAEQKAEILDRFLNLQAAR